MPAPVSVMPTSSFTASSAKSAATSTSASAANIGTGRRFDYVHVLLLVEHFKPLPSLPINTRIIAQVESPINLTVASDDDRFLDTIDYTPLPKLVQANQQRWTDDAAHEEKTNAAHGSEVLIAQQALLAGFHSMLGQMRRHYGQQSSVNWQPQTSPQYLTEYTVQLETLRNVRNPVNPAGDSRYSIMHTMVRRQLATQGKQAEALQKIDYVLHSTSKRDTAVRLDYLNLNELTVPAELFALPGQKDIHEVNMSHSNFLYFPTSFCASFREIRTLDMSSNQQLFHVPAEIALLKQLTHLNLTDCTQLLSLPLSLPKLKGSLKQLLLFGCTQLSFPPYCVAVRAQIATLEGQSEAGVRGVLEYVENPQSWLSFNLNEMKRRVEADAHKPRIDPVYNRLTLSIPAFRKATDHVEYEVHVQCCNSEWSVYRRFSAFRSFVGELEGAMAAAEFGRLGKLPGKTWSLHEEDAGLCEERRVAMEALCLGLREWDGLNERRRRESVGRSEQKGTRGLFEMPFVRAFVELDANVPKQ